MNKIIEWVKSSNHYLHIGLLAALSLVMLSVGAFEFGADGLWTNVWQTVKFGVLVGVVIEAYQYFLSKVLNMKNTLGDLVADVIGLVLGVGVYLLLVWCSPVSAIIAYIVAVASLIFAFALPEWKYYLLILFLGCAMVGFSLFIYA
jgi:hypothetical protein